LNQVSRQCPELSIVVVGFDMQRELPRTLLSLGSTYQRGMKAANYEVIVVDNGSTIPLSGRDIEHLSADIHLIDMPRPCSVSPSRAVNAGIAAARGNLIGVWIDGARLASAGLLGTALIASRLHERAIIGTLGFHLGPDTQMNSVKAGYDQTTEDALLDSIDWPKDPDRLFEISTFAGSSRRGWFGPIAESNALFMRRSGHVPRRGVRVHGVRRQPEGVLHSDDRQSALASSGSQSGLKLSTLM